MKQVFQSARSGEILVAEVPAPQPTPGAVLVRNAASLVSAGTERMALDFAEKNLLQKAKARPDLVRQVIDKVRREGILSTMDAVRSRLDQPMAPGYSSAGTVVAVGDGISDIHVGDLVACAGLGYASHAEFVAVPRMLVAKLPSGASSQLLPQAAFTTLGSIALHGVRLSEAKLGDTIAVIGLGLVGQLTVQLLKAAGCRVIGMDLQSSRAELAAQLGADEVASVPETMRALCDNATAGTGVDVVLVTADTSSNDPVQLAGEIARDRAIVVAVGAVGTEIPRRSYYQKELDFRISRSYGPGRYDPAYEEAGRDYPVGYVRWTENRNMQAFLQLLADGKLNLKPLVTHTFAVENAADAYHLISGKSGAPFLGVLITYAAGASVTPRIDLRSAASPSATLKAGVLGAGNFATAVLIPAMKATEGVDLVAIATSNGLRARHAGDQFGFRWCGSDPRELLASADINTVVIATRHNRHAEQVIAAFKAGKHVYCEKPLCLAEDELAAIVRELRARPGQLLSVGFNRRFAPLAQKLRAFAADAAQPLLMHYRVNAGPVPADHWIQDPQQGGGRIIGEVCHFIDLLSYLASSEPLRASAHATKSAASYRDDNLAIVLEFANGSVGTITYAASGDRACGKERVEVFAGGGTACLDDFRSLEIVRNGRRNQQRSRLRQEKGFAEEWRAMVAALRSGIPPIPLNEIVATTLASFRIVQSLRSGAPALVNTNEFISAALADGGQPNAAAQPAGAGTN